MNSNQNQTAAQIVTEDEAWEARGRMAAREQVARQMEKLDDSTLSVLRESAHADRHNLVNFYSGPNREENLAELDLVIGAIEEEQAKRAGLASSADILAMLLPAQENRFLSVAEAEALPQPEHYEAGQRVILTSLPHVGATIRQVEGSILGIDYDASRAAGKSRSWAKAADIRPMPYH